MGLAMIVSGTVTAMIWLRATTRQISIPLRGMLPTLRQSGQVALMAAIGPAIALWIYGPYPDLIVAPLLVGGTLGFVGFVLGILASNHPLKVEITAVWSRVKR